MDLCNTIKMRCLLIICILWSIFICKLHHTWGVAMPDYDLKREDVFTAKIWLNTNWSHERNWTDSANADLWITFISFPLIVLSSKGKVIVIHFRRERTSAPTITYFGPFLVRCCMSRGAVWSLSSGLIWNTDQFLLSGKLSMGKFGHLFCWKVRYSCLDSRQRRKSALLGSCMVYSTLPHQWSRIFRSGKLIIPQ